MWKPFRPYDPSAETLFLEPLSPEGGGVKQQLWAHIVYRFSGIRTEYGEEGEAHAQMKVRDVFHTHVHNKQQVKGCE